MRGGDPCSLRGVKRGTRNRAPGFREVVRPESVNDSVPWPSRGATGGDGLGGVYAAAEATHSLTRSLRASVPTRPPHRRAHRNSANFLRCDRPEPVGWFVRLQGQGYVACGTAPLADLPR